MSPVLPNYFLVEDPHRQILNQLFDGVQQTPSWHQVQGSCFVMAGFIQLAFQALGHTADILPCTGLAVYQQRPFKLGFPGIKRNESQLDGHVCCLVDNKILVDFGLSNVQRYGFPEFPIALAADCKEVPIFPITLHIHDEDMHFQWDTQQVHPAIEQAVQNHKAHAQQLYREYKTLKA
jgi:hypothetical protein